MNNLKHVHPLDRLINDDSLFFLEAMVPFIDYQYKLPLILYIKYREVTQLMQCLSDKKYVSECGFDCHPKSQEEMISSICNILPNDFANTFNQMKKMMQMMSVMNSMSGDNNQTDHKSYSGEYTKQDTGDSLYDSVMSILSEGK